jgi:nuclear pore complex protein Nup133
METCNPYDFTPWYVQFHSLKVLTKQAGIILSASQLTEDTSVKIDLFKQLEQLTDLILDGLKTNVESLKSSERYSEKFGDFEIKRAKLLGNLVEMDPVGALSLAEKYLDFNLLVSVCYNQKDYARLELFFEKYFAFDFPRYTFEWYLKQKKDPELIETFSSSKYQALLGDFLKDYPQISWHHSTLIEDFKGASHTLMKLAKAEESSADDKKFMLCMAKLGILASGGGGEEDPKQYEDINRDLAVIRYQNELSDEALEQYGLDRETMRVLTPIQLIDIYTTDLVEPDVMNYWKATCLCKYVGQCRVEKRSVDFFDFFSSFHISIDVSVTNAYYDSF